MAEKKTTQMHMSVGKNIGKVMLEIAQDCIKDGDPERAIKNYIEGFHGFTREYALMVLKNEAAIVAADGGTVNLTDDPEVLEENRQNMFDWPMILKGRYDYLEALRDSIFRDKSRLQRGGVTADYIDLEVYGPDGVRNAVCRVIKSGRGNCYHKIDEAFDRLEQHVIDDEDEKGRASQSESVMYGSAMYFLHIRQLIKDFRNWLTVSEWLNENGIVNLDEILPNHVDEEERGCLFLTEFMKGQYKVPMAMTEIHAMQKSVMPLLKKFKVTRQWLDDGILPRNIELGYDAGWLSPEGVFYGANGESGAFLHLGLAESLYKGKYRAAMEADGIHEIPGFDGSFKGDDPDQWLEHQGWIKIHHDEVYGCFKSSKDMDLPWAYMPTQAQVDAICRYSRKCWPKGIVTAPRVTEDREPVTAYKLSQMDEFKLHELFSRF